MLFTPKTGKDLHWCPMRQTGIVLHMLGRISECGVVSMTAISNSLEEARTLFQASRDYILAEAQRDITL